MSGAVEWRTGVDFYLLAGVATYPSFFTACASRLEQLAAEHGSPDSSVRDLYPYGDYTHRIIGQIRRIGRDMARSRVAGERSVLLHNRSGRRHRKPDGLDEAAHAIGRLSAGRTAVLIGHSGGGVAAYHIARRLLAAGTLDCRVAQIGSPKVRISPDMRERVGYFYAVNEHGRRDPITKLGSWGSMRTNERGLPVWDAHRNCPGTTGKIVLIGGHADYFRGGEGYRRDGESNLDRTIGCLHRWLNHTDRT